MAEEWITVEQLAKELNVHANTARRIAVQCGIMPIRRRVPGGSHQRPLHVTREQAEEIKARRLADGFMP